MKRIIAIILGVSLYISIFGTMTVVAKKVEEVELVINSGFEKGMSGWTATGCKMTIGKKVVKNGLRSVLVSSRANSYSSPFQNITEGIVVGQHYTVSAWVKGTKPNMRAVISVDMRDSQGARLEMVNTPVVNLGDDWQKISSMIKVSKESVSSIRLYIDTVNTNHDIYVDDFSFTYSVDEEAQDSKEETAQEKYYDIKGTKLELPQYMLQELGVQSGYNTLEFAPTTEVTRAEYVTAITALGRKTLIETTPSGTVFRDVPASHNDAQAIATAKQNGLISGDAKSAFRPNDTITYSEALKVLLNVMGYDKYAYNRGGFPLGYYVVGREIGLFDNPSNPEKLTRYDMTMLIYSALKAPVMQVKNINTNGTWEYSKDQLGLKHFFDLELLNGVVTANNKTNLLGKLPASKNGVRIDDIYYEYHNSNENDMLGKTVAAFVDVEENIVHHMKDSTNEVFKITYKDLETNSTDFSRTKIIYNTDKRTAYVKVKEDASIIYNGILYNNFGDDVFNLNSGDIECIDANSDGVYETINITEYRDMYVLSVDSLQNAIYTFGEGKLTLNDKDIVISADGQIKTISAVKKDMLISYLAPNGDGEKTVFINNKLVEGTISELMLGDDELVVNDEKYRFANSYKDASNNLINKIYVGQKVKLFINIGGEIAWIERVNSEVLDYGYLYKLDEGVFNDSAQAKIMNMVGDKNIYNFANKVKFGVETIGVEQLLKKTNLVTTSNVVIPQLVKFRLNEKGDVTELQCATNTDVANGKWFDDNNFSYEGEIEAYHTKIPKTLTTNETSYILDDNLVIFVVPPLVNGVIDEEKMAIASLEIFKNTINYKNLKIYDVTREKKILALVTPPMAVGHKIQSYISVAVKVTSIIDDDGLKRKRLTAFYRGKEIQYLAKTDSLFDAIKTGAIIRVSLDEEGLVEQIIPAIGDVSSPGQYFESIIYGSNFNGDLTQSYGVAYSAAKGVVAVSIDNGLTVRPYVVNNSTIVYRYDSKKVGDKQVTVATLSDIISNDGTNLANNSKLFLNKILDVVTEIVIID